MSKVPQMELHLIQHPFNDVICLSAPDEEGSQLCGNPESSSELSTGKMMLVTSHLFPEELQGKNPGGDESWELEWTPLKTINPDDSMIFI